MSVPESPPIAPLRRSTWPYLALVGLVSAGLFALDDHRPLPWPDAAAPWFEYVRAVSPGARGIDRLNALAVVTPDLPLASAMVLLALGASSLATLRVLGVPPWLALAVAGGSVAIRSIWSTAAPGTDALPMLLVSLGVLRTARPARDRWLRVAPYATALLAPAAAVLTLPAVVGHRTRRLGRAVTTASVVAIVLAVQALLAWHASTAIACLPPSAWPAALADVWRPGLSADASAWIALRQWTAVLVGDVHLFGVLGAAYGLGTAASARTTGTTGAHGMLDRAPLRRATVVAVLLSAAAVGTGVLPPALGAALLLPWWTPWFGLGLAALVARAEGRQRHVVAVLAASTAVALPLLRHAVVMPGPWVTGMPGTTRAAIDGLGGGVITIDDMTAARRLHAAGAATVPTDPVTVAACVATGTQVSALGATVTSIEHSGFAIDDEPLRAAMADVLRDVRADQLVALAVAPSSLPWIGVQGMSILERLDVRRQQIQATTALALVARTDDGGRVAAQRDAAELGVRIGDDVAGRRLVRPLTVSAHLGEAVIDNPPRRIAIGAYGALAVFDRSQDVAFRAAMAAAPGLPVALSTHASWRRAVVSGQPHCVRVDTTWTALPGTMARLSVPIAAASSRRPAIVYMASDDRPQPDVRGLASDPAHGDVVITSFDTREPAEAAQLKLDAARDGLPPTTLPHGRWIARVAIAPRDAWHPSQVAVSSGLASAAWAIRLAGGGWRASTSDVCRMDAAGERLFHGHVGAVDDDTPHEIALRVLEGWHRPERLQGQVHQWTSRPRASVGFRSVRPSDLVLAMDAEAATTGHGPQQLSVLINGQILVADWRGPRRVEVPASVLRTGENTLSLEVPEVVQPPRDPRALGVLVRQLRLIDAARR